MKVHLSAIAGTAMASLAGLLRERGHEVTGSDQDIYPPMSTQLEELGIPVRSPYAEENVPADADLVVIGNALSRGNPEVEIVLDRKQRMASLPQVLAEQVIRGHESLVVAGTHGKTTTTSMLAFLLDQAGLDPSFLIGGVPADFARSYRIGGGRHFVVEGDEYDSAFFDKRPKFLHYLPDIAVIGNLEYDHADIYPDLASVQLAFARLIQLIPRRGLLVAGIESAPLREILPRALCRVETFTLGPGRRTGGGRRRARPRTGAGGSACGTGARTWANTASSSRASTTSATRSRPSPWPTRSESLRRRRARSCPASAG
jgi:UDP-N-acetylmuramate: L-alanyl-gamma-D-glutamyl-meso-diaminopimelate ligase